ncbi:transcription termination/antitermination protein NusG [Gulosibacter sediminis]|uniref:transcription termination/antitermination protein NusG n=1 Tax=Gulosibacter sediminis TaxID=1729695 RepID=UPI0024AE1B5F|nr:transcription termination/antitermination protein NusG [Gulosibacter sediminis]
MADETQLPEQNETDLDAVNEAPQSQDAPVEAETNDVETDDVETNDVETEAVAADAVEADASDGAETVDAESADAEPAAEGEAVEGEAAEGDDEAEVDPYAEFKLELRMKPGKWYVIHTYAGFERKVRDNLQQRVENKKRSESSEGADDIYEVQVPMEDVVEMKNGQRKMVTRVRIPGYVLVRMHLTEDSWSLVRQTPGVTGFVGNAHDPVPLRFKEVFEMLKSIVELPDVKDVKGEAKAGAATGGKQPITEVEFENGETVTIKEGSFEGLTGSISEINAAAGKLIVLVSLFGRETPVELSFDEVAKL